MEAINRACQLIEELDAGDVVGGVVDVYPDPVTKKRLPFEPAKYNALLGTNVSDEDMLSYFERLEVEYDKDANELIIPTFRQDLNRDADMAEEVARFFGYDNIQQHFHPERLQQVSFRLSFASSRWQVILLSSVDSARE